MIESTLAQKFQMIAKSNSVTLSTAVAETMEKVAREQFMTELFREASGLLDPKTNLQTESNEYHRALAELVQRATGSDDFDDVVDIISEGTGIYRVTEQDFAVAPGGDPLYVGPFAVAIAYVKANCEWEVKQTADDKVHVDLDKGNCFGVADTAEMAWRYAIAAELYGNDGATFSPFLLK